MVDYLKEGTGWANDTSGGLGKTASSATAGNNFGTGSLSKGSTAVGTAWGDNLKGLLPWIGGGAGVAGLIGGMFFGKTSNQPNAVASQSVTEPDPTIDYNQDSNISGAENSLTYKVTGVSNQLNKWGPFNTVFGEKVKFYPVKGMESYGSGAYNIGCLDLGYGELVIDPADFAIGGRPLSDFPGLLTEIQYGRTDDAPFVTSLKASSSENCDIPLGIADGYKTIRIGKAGTQMGATVTFPYGLWDRNTYFPNVDEPYAVSFAFEYKKTTSNVWLAGATLSVTEMYKVAFSRSVAWNISDPGEYDIRVVRTSGGEVFPYGVYASGEARANLTYIYAFYDAPDPPFKDVFDSKGNKVLIPRILLKTPNTVEGANAQEDFSCKPSRKLRHWDGTQWVAPAVSSHPPDEVLEVLQGQGAFEQVPDENIDLDSFWEWSVFCYNNNLTYRKVVDQGINTQELIDEIAACGRANIVNINGKYTAIVDKPRPSVTQHFSLHTIIKDSFTAQASLGESPQVIYAQFLNPDKDWAQDEIEVYDDGFDKDNKTLVPQTILFPGCTNSTEAHKRARYLMACTRLQFWTYTFRVATSHLACKLGDRVRVTHDAIFAGLGQGRISRLITNEAGDLTGLRIDAPQEIEAGKTYGIKTMAGNHELNFQLSNAVGETQEFTFTTPLSDDAEYWPVKGNQVLFGEVNFEAVDCIITEILPAEDFTAQLTLIDYNEGCYVADTEPIPAYVSRISTKQGIDKSVGMPTVLNVDSGNAALQSLGAGRFASGILLTLHPEALPIESYEAKCKLSSVEDIETNWTSYPFQSAESGQFRIPGVIDGELYDVKIRNRRADNYVSAWVYACTNHKVIGQTAKPPDVPGTVKRLPNSKVIKWFYDLEHGVVVPIDHVGFKIKISNGSIGDWEHGLVVEDRWPSTSYDFSGLVAGAKVIMIKAVDFQGNESAGPAAFISIDFGDVEIDNVVERVWLSPKYNGVTIDDEQPASMTAQNFFPHPLSSPWLPANINGPWVSMGYVPGPKGLIQAEAISPPMFPANLADPWITDVDAQLAPTVWDTLFARFEVIVPEIIVFPATLKLVYEIVGAFNIQYRPKGEFPFVPNLSAPMFPTNLADPWLTLDNPTWLPYLDSGIPGDKKTVPQLQWDGPFIQGQPSDPLLPRPASGPWFKIDNPVWLKVQVPGTPNEKRFEFKIDIAGGRNRGALKKLGYFWDVPDKTVYVNDLIVDDPAGVKLHLEARFNKVENIQVTCEQLPEFPDAVYGAYEGKGTAPLILVKDRLNNLTTGQVDVTIKGY